MLLKFKMSLDRQSLEDYVLKETNKFIFKSLTEEEDGPEGIDEDGKEYMTVFGPVNEDDANNFMTTHNDQILSLVQKVMNHGIIQDMVSENNFVHHKVFETICECFYEENDPLLQEIEKFKPKEKFYEEDQ